MNINKIFGDNMRAKRLELGMTQEDLADKANLHRTYISNIENYTRNVSLETVEKIAKALNVEPADLLRTEQ